MLLSWWYGVHVCCTLDTEQSVGDKIFIDDNGTHVNDNDDDNDESHDDG